MSILVTGGAGYIGSHTCVALLEAGYDVVVVDNLSHSSANVLGRIEEITGKKVSFYQVDILDKTALREVFKKEKIEAVMHFAGWKVVSESLEKPLEYYYNNITGLLTLCMIMRENCVKQMIFSSSAAVYGEVKTIPISESCPRGQITNPYGQTKAMLEQVLMDLHASDPEWKIVLLRYFNPLGAHESGRIGEDPYGTPSNLLPYIAQVAVGNLPYLNVYGDDYDTPDGTGVRDYIHVMDLAKGHVAALGNMQKGVHIYNLGTGRGHSVLEVLRAYEKACGKKIPRLIQPRRAGDVAVSFCDAAKAEKELGWKAEKTLEDMCRDSWNWQRMNPNGYGE